MGREIAWQQTLLRDVEGVQLCEDALDCWSWDAAPDGVYSVNSAYLFLQGPEVPVTDSVISDIWRSFAPSNIKAFTWRLLLDRIASRENLLKRHVLPSVDAATCILCQCHVETSFHLLFSCSFAMQVWQRCFSWLCLSPSSPSSVREHLSEFQLGRSSSQKKAARAIWMARVWSIG